MVLDEFLIIRDDGRFFLFDDGFRGYGITGLGGEDARVELGRGFLGEGGCRARALCCLCFTKVVCIGNCEVLETRRCSLQPVPSAAAPTRQVVLIGWKTGREGKGTVPFDEGCEVDALCGKHGRLFLLVFVCCLCAVTCLWRVFSVLGVVACFERGSPADLRDYCRMRAANLTSIWTSFSSTWLWMDEAG